MNVSVVVPGAVDTPFFERRGSPYTRGYPVLIPPDRVAETVVRAVGRRRDESFGPRLDAVPGPPARCRPRPLPAPGRPVRVRPSLRGHLHRAQSGADSADRASSPADGRGGGMPAMNAVWGLMHQFGGKIDPTNSVPGDLHDEIAPVELAAD